MNLRRLVWRSWSYFRLGYGTYLALLIGVFSNIIVIYKLFLAEDPTLLAIFPHITNFMLVSIPAGTVASILVGYIHFKRTRAFQTDVIISTEVNPYNWISVPGKERELTVPVAILQLECQRALLKAQGVWTDKMELETNRAIGAFEKLRRGERMDS
jgi:hypothetical protein